MSRHLVDYRLGCVLGIAVLAGAPWARARPSGLVIDGRGELRCGRSV